MTIKGWFAAAFIAGGLVYGIRGGCLNSGTAPDEKLVSELDDLCVIARDHIATPERGVRKLGKYIGDHNLVGDLAATITMIEKIDDDRAHDNRARLVRKRLEAQVRSCEQDWMRFAEAVEADPKASALIDRAMRRLNRTLEIIFQGHRLDFRQLPAELGQLIGTTAR